MKVPKNPPCEAYPESTFVWRRRAWKFLREDKSPSNTLDASGMLSNLTSLWGNSFLGAMISRNTETIRVLASGMSLEDIVRYLQRIGFRGSLGHLALIADISELTNHMWLAADIEETGVSPRIGFELYCMSSAQSPNNKEWTSLLDFFAEKGICADHKRNALLAAADMSNRESDELAWPDSLRKVSNMMGPAGFDRLAFRIHHLKVTDRPGVPLEAKAYLCGSYKQRHSNEQRSPADQTEFDSTATVLVEASRTAVLPSLSARPLLDTPRSPRQAVAEQQVSFGLVNLFGLLGG